MSKIDWKAVGDKVGQACGFVGVMLITAVSIPIALAATAMNESSYEPDTSYSDVICTIIDKVCFASDQKKIIALVNAKGTAGYYKAVKHIVENTLFTSDMADLIERLNGK